MDQLKQEDKKLYEISVKFSELTKEAKRVLDNMKAKSDERRKQYGVEGEDYGTDHHRELPTIVVKDIERTNSEVSSTQIDLNSG